MLRVILGLVKGLIVGGGVGFGLIKLGLGNYGWAAYLACIVVGAVVGVVCGRAPWKSETIWTPVVKLVVGAIIGAGLCALGRSVLPSFELHTASLLGADVLTTGGGFLAAAVGVLYGVFVEVDDGGKSDAKAEKDKAAKPTEPAAPRRLKG